KGELTFDEPLTYDPPATAGAVSTIKPPKPLPAATEPEPATFTPSRSVFEPFTMACASSEIAPLAAVVSIRCPDVIALLSSVCEPGNTVATAEIKSFTLWPNTEMATAQISATPAMIKPYSTKP